MNTSFILLFFALCFIYQPYTFAMQLPSSKQNKMIQLPVVKTIVLPTNLIAIRSSTCGRIGILDSKGYTLWDHDKGTTISKKSGIIENISNLCFHPVQDKIFIFGDGNNDYVADKKALLIRYDYCGDGTSRKTFSYPDYEIASGLFSREESILFMAHKNELIFYNYRKETESRKTLKKNVGTLFTYPFHNQKYFLCSGDSQRKIYKITRKYKNYSIKQLVELSFDVDFSNWIYHSQEGLFFFINKENRMLYIISIKNQKKPQEKKYRYNDGFSIATMAIHPNKKILVLVAEKDDMVEFVSVKDYTNIKHLYTATHEPLNNNFDSQHNAKKTTFSRSGEYVFIANGQKCFMLDLPPFLKYFDVFERIVMKQVFEKCGIPADVRKSMWYFLWQLFIKDYCQ